MMPVFQGLLNKLQQVSLSDLNHELGKAKENVVYESGSYLETFKQDAAAVGTILKSESSRLGSWLGRRSAVGCGQGHLSKSTSLPLIPSSPAPASSSCGPCRTSGVRAKYRYRSTCEGAPIVSPADLFDQESLLTRFIRVVGADGPETEPNRICKESEGGGQRRTSTREDIRRKLANFGEEQEEEEEPGLTLNNNLEVCYINETASDEEDNVCMNPLAEISEEDDNTDEEEEDIIPSFPRSKSDWEALRRPDVSRSLEEWEAERHRQRLLRLQQKEQRRRNKAQRAARIALAQCSQVARRQMVLEKQRRLEDSRLRKMLGLDNSELRLENLQNFNVATLQVILNDFREKIEKYNSELVELLILKDELSNEQESMLIDIEDISHAAPKL